MGNLDVSDTCCRGLRTETAQTEACTLPPGAVSREAEAIVAVSNALVIGGAQRGAALLVWATRRQPYGRPPNEN